MALMHRLGTVRRMLTVGAAALALSWVVPVGAVDPDGAFLSARDAFQKGQIERLNELAEHLTNYPLYPYIAAWQLRSRLADTPPDEVQRFLAAQGDSLAGQRLRGDWLKQLAQGQAWDRVRAGIPGLRAERCRGGVLCTAGAARARRPDRPAGSAAPVVPGRRSARELRPAVRCAGDPRADHRRGCLDAGPPGARGRQRELREGADAVPAAGQAHLRQAARQCCTQPAALSGAATSGAEDPGRSGAGDVRDVARRAEPACRGREPPGEVRHPAYPPPTAATCGPRSPPPARSSTAAKRWTGSSAPGMRLFRIGSSAGKLVSACAPAAGRACWRPSMP